MIRLIMVALAFATAAPAFAAPCGEREAALREAKLVTWPKLYRTRDSKGLANFLAEGFVSMAADGTLTTRAEEVAWVAANPWQPQDFRYTITRIDCPAPGVGVVLGKGQSVRAGEGSKFAQSYVSSNLFVYQGGRWRAAMSHVSGAQTEPVAASIEADLLAVERRWNRAVAERDGAAVAEILSDDFVFIAPNGAIVGKAALVHAASDTAYVIDPFETVEPLVRVYGSTAVITGTFVQSGHFKGAPFSGRYAYTDVYAQRGGRWVAVSAQASALASAKAPNG